MAKYKYILKEGVLKPKDIDPALIKRIEAKYGPIDMTNDFFADDLKTYFKTDSIDKETGKISHSVIKLASFGDSLEKMSDAVLALKQLMGTEDGRNDEIIKTVASELKDVFNKYRTHLRKNYPDQYNMIKNQLSELIGLDETSTIASNSSFNSGTEGENYATPFAFNPNKKAKGAATNYYYKLGFKPAPKPKSSKTIDIVSVNGKTEPLKEAETNIEEYINDLGVESSALKKHITSRVLGFDKIENKLNELIPLIAQAKNKTMDKYKEKPDFSVVYGTDLAVDYIDDLIEMFKDK
jgi:hypothetical protein